MTHKNLPLGEGPNLYFSQGLQAKLANLTLLPTKLVALAYLKAGFISSKHLTKFSYRRALHNFWACVLRVDL